MLRYLMVRSWSCGGTVNMQDLIDKRAHTYSPRSKNVSHSCNACAGRMPSRSRCLALTMCMTPISASATLPQNRNEDAHRPRPSATLWIARADREGDMSGDRAEVSYGRPCCPIGLFQTTCSRHGCPHRRCGYPGSPRRVLEVERHDDDRRGCAPSCSFGPSYRPTHGKLC
jgi:hypothetical protein